MERVFTQTFGVVGAIIEKDGKILLVKEAGTLDKGKWNRPAGWIDVGENPIDMVKREVKEETGLDFEPIGLIGIYSSFRMDLKEKHGITPHPIVLLFRGVITGGKLIDHNEEIDEVRWFTPEEIMQMDKNILRDEHIKISVQDYFAGRNFPLDIIRHTVQE